MTQYTKTVYSSFMMNALKQARLDRDKTLKEAGDKIGVSAEAFRRYETGERNPDPEVLAKIHREFGVDPNSFYGFSDAASTSEIIISPSHPTSDF